MFSVSPITLLDIQNINEDSDVKPALKLLTKETPQLSNLTLQQQGATATLEEEPTLKKCTENWHPDPNKKRPHP